MLPHALSKLSVPALSNLKPGIILRSWLKADRETLEVDAVLPYTSRATEFSNLEWTQLLVFSEIRCDCRVYSQN